SVEAPIPGRFVRRAAGLAALLSTGVFVSLSLPLPARADVGADMPKSAPVAALLHDDRAIVEWIKKHHYDVLAAAARTAQARADLGTARLFLPNPQLDIGVGGLGFAPSTSYGTTGNFAVGITQTIELGKRGVRIDAAELRAEESSKTFLDTLGDRV